MASIIKTSINLNDIPKDKIINGKKGKYLPITITLNDEVDQFGNQGPVMVEQSKEERDAKIAKVYLEMLRLYGLTVQTLELHRDKMLDNRSLKKRQLLLKMIFRFKVIALK